MPDVDPAAIKAAIAVRFETVDDVAEVRTTEPTSITNTPAITMFTSGFARRALESPYVEGDRVLDPIGARTWLWEITCRLWVPLGADVEAAQVDADALAVACVRAYEQDCSLGGLAVDSVVSSGTFAKVTPQDATNAQPLLMCEMSVQVEITERL